MRTKEEIDAEIVALEDCLTFAPPRSSFGDDNHRNIRVQIRVLKGDIEVGSDEFYGDSLSDYDRDAACEVQYWLDGDEDEPASAGWQAFRGKS